MATLALTVGGAAVGGALLPGGVTFLGATISGAALGATAGALVGSAIDQRLFTPSQNQHHQRAQQGPRLNSVDISSSTEGTGIPRLQGRSRMPGQIIWATRFEEEIRTESETQVTGGGGGKGGGGGGTTTTTTRTTTYHYFGNFAVGVCEGPVTRIGRIWADGKELDQSEVTIRKYVGEEDQEPDSLIEAKEGQGNAPAYRGLAYVVFERLPLDQFGRRIPQISIEVWRSVGDLENEVRGVALIPGSTEFGYDPDRVARRGADGWEGDNRQTMEADSDWQASLDLLEEVAPNTQTVLFVVAWFGSDLRAGECIIEPKVEGRDRATRKGGSSFPWQVAGLTRTGESQAELVSFVDPGSGSGAGRPAYGGSPNDESVTLSIQDLKSRGYTVIFCPFILMDIAQDNALPNPYSDNASEEGQPAYPWRGRITCSPAPGFDGSPDKTSAAADQIVTFFNREWGYRNFILHYANLCEEAGGVDAFLIGSEMVALTSVRSDADTYPFVDALIDLAADVRQVVGPATRVSYAADWSEYHSHRPEDGSGDVYFNLDPLWSDSNIDFVAIDNYLPISDWRDGTDHADYAPDGPNTIYDVDYLKANIEGGEYYDWFYETEADRFNQARTSITDGDHDEPWVFRNKDIRNWWLNAHHNRPGGVRESASTGWTPQSKPIVFTEFGCPAIDKGTNQPNVFFDPKSSESFFPHFSSGGRDDAMQRAYLEALLEYWTDAANNPTSTVYSGPMIDVNLSCIWTWDARMVPSFPQDNRTWADGDNWDRGHWISGRFGLAVARETIRDIFEQAGFQDYEIRPIGSVVDAVIGDRVLSPRAMLEALSSVHALFALESGDVIRVQSRLNAGVTRRLSVADMVESGEAERFQKTRAQETDLPREINLTYGEPTSDDQSGGVRAIRQVTESQRVMTAEAPVVMPAAKAQAAAEVMLHDAWYGRERLEFALPPSALALEPGDTIRLDPEGEDYRIDGIADGGARRCRLGRMDTGLLVPAHTPKRERATPRRREVGTADFVLIDGPLLSAGHDPYAGYAAATMTPWAGGVSFYRSPGTSGFAFDTLVSAPCTIGETLTDFFSYRPWVWDTGNQLWVELLHGELSSEEDLFVLNGANPMAIRNPDGEWEVFQFAEAELVDTRTYRLSRLLRGQRGTEHAMRDPVPAGAPVVFLNDALRQTGIGPDEIGLALNWRVGPAIRDVAHDTYQQEAFTMHGRALRPLSPVHIRGRRYHLTGDWMISWKRRTRIGGDGWDQPDVPLGEEEEEYRLEILDGGAVVRTVSGLPVPGYLYEAAEQQADFGAPVWSFNVRVQQVSREFGAGIAAEALIFN